MRTIIEQENTTYRRLACILILIGVLLGVDSFIGSTVFLNLWPILVLVLGLGFIGIFSKGRRKGFTYLVIGIYMILFTALALYCNFTTWSILNKFWPIFIMFLGVAFIIICFANKSHKIMFFAGLLLIFLAIYFYAIFSITTNAWWSIFILAGICILLSRIKK